MFFHFWLDYLCLSSQEFMQMFEEEASELKMSPTAKEDYLESLMLERQKNLN